MRRQKALTRMVARSLIAVPNLLLLYITYRIKFSS
jgi:hypothetical protein